ncbi:hypothetical protein VNI00_013013 [Paramarasmius palmivorus]|uniref:Uncharacterized protein n=1 Tax=Paramarasmius palmivorus TaxID=297713 RepID=A0AAW0C0G5_9AGAR
MSHAAMEFPWPAPKTMDELKELHTCIMRSKLFTVKRKALYLGTECWTPRLVRVPTVEGALSTDPWNVRADLWVTPRDPGSVAMVEMLNDENKLAFQCQYTAFFYPNEELDRLTDLNEAWLQWDKEVGSLIHDRLGPGFDDCRLLGPLLIVKHNLKGEFTDMNKMEVDTVLSIFKGDLMRRDPSSGKRFLDGFTGSPVPSSVEWLENLANLVNRWTFITGKRIEIPPSLSNGQASSFSKGQSVSQGEKDGSKKTGKKRDVDQGDDRELQGTRCVNILDLSAGK